MLLHAGHCRREGRLDPGVDIDHREGSALEVRRRTVRMEEAIRAIGCPDLEAPEALAGVRRDRQPVVAGPIRDGSTASRDVDIRVLVREGDPSSR